MAALAPVKQDVARQRSYDSRRPTQWPIYYARLAAVDSAAAALAEEEVGAKYALRQALIDLASACEEIAATMPRPLLPD